MAEFTWMCGDGPGFENARAVRRRVFVEEQGFSLEGEFDQQDKASWHIIGFDGEQPVCTARVFPEKEPGVWHAGRIAVLSTRRGRGEGLAMMEEVAKKVRALGGNALVLSAQHDKAGFYQKAGYALTGETMLDEGYPHVWMRLDL